MRFPTRSDYVAFFIGRGLVRDEGDLTARRPDLVCDALLNWLRHSASGCRFATQLAVKRDAARWLTAAFPSRRPDQEFRRDVAAVVQDWPDIELVLMAFPWVSTTNDLVFLINQMALCDGWWWEEPPAVDQHDDVLVGLRWDLPSEKSTSWALGFAPFDFMPFTRRAPWTAIVLRPRDAPPENRPTEGLAPVHLAQVPHFFGERGRFEGEIWNSTKELRRALLGGELEAAAKARVTFNLPSKYRPALAPPGR